MRTIMIDELKDLRKQYKPSDLETEITRINSLDRPVEWKERTIERKRAASAEIAKNIKEFDKVIKNLESRPLLPDSHGGQIEMATIWTGALFLIRDDPSSYQIEVPQYGTGNVRIRN